MISTVNVPKGKKLRNGTGIGLNPQFRKASIVVVSEASHTTLSYRNDRHLFNFEKPF